VIWGPFVLAMVLGSVVSAGLYLVVIWPRLEPPETDDD
jgi:hypothetical protein